ncbi:MAG: hypothetical protein AAFY88_27690 [Acidobacteriota bacterium]
MAWLERKIHDRFFSPITCAGAAVELFEGSSLPSWFDEREAGIAGDFSGELDFLGAPVTDIPTGDGIGLLALIGLLIAAAWQRHCGDCAARSDEVSLRFPGPA